MLPGLSGKIKFYNKVAILMFLGLFFSSSSAWANPDFELDLNELRKPVHLPTATKPKRSASNPQASGQSRADHIKPAARAGSNKPTASVRPKAVTNKSNPTTKQTVAPKVTARHKKSGTQSVAAVVPVSELVLQRGGDSCQMASNLLSVLAESVKAEKLLHGVDLKVKAAVSYDGVGVLLACNLEQAEFYTYNRMLEAYNVILLNVCQDEKSADVAFRLLEALKVAYHLESAARNKQQTTWLLPADEYRSRPLRLTVLH